MPKNGLQRKSLVAPYHVPELLGRHSYENIKVTSAAVLGVRHVVDTATNADWVERQEGSDVPRIARMTAEFLLDALIETGQLNADFDQSIVASAIHERSENLLSSARRIANAA